MYEIIFLDEVGEEARDTATSKETFDWKMSALRIAGATIVRSGKVNDTDRISPDDIGNDIHDFLHGGKKMNEPVAWRVKNTGGMNWQLLCWEPKGHYDFIEPLYTSEQLHPRVKMTQAEFDETVAFIDRSGDRAFGRLYEVLTVIKENPSDDRYYNLYLRLFGNADDVIDSEKQYEFATLFMLKNPEETIEIVPDMKWFVRSLVADEGYYSYLFKHSNRPIVDYEPSKQPRKEYMTFDTKSEAEKWTNPLTETVQLPVEGE